MSPEARIRELIQDKGYITVAEFMHEVLTKSYDSYYRLQEAIGENADFITAPEISQLYGEMIAIWCIETWRNMGSPKELNLIELGPGRGTLMSDFLRTANYFPEFADSLNIHLVEISESLKSTQQQTLTKYGNKIQWHTDIPKKLKGPVVIIANEFFDALPTKQLIKEKDNWFEQIITLDPKDANLSFDKMALPQNLQEQINAEHPNAKDGAVYEESIASLIYMQKICEIIKKHQGTALIIDYGYDIAYKDRLTNQYTPTIQAIKNHNYKPIFENIGYADLTAHVDFYALKQIASRRKLNIYGTNTQGNFLRNLGIELRLNQLASQSDLETAIILRRQVSRLIEEKQMGALFKVFAVSSKDIQISIGF